MFIRNSVKYKNTVNTQNNSQFAHKWITIRTIKNISFDMMTVERMKMEYIRRKFPPIRDDEEIISFRALNELH